MDCLESYRRRTRHSGDEITFVHHKGADRKPRPYVIAALPVYLIDVCAARTTFLFHEETLPILCPVAHILAMAIKDDAIKVDGYTRAEPFFESNLQNPKKAVLVHWKPKMLKIPIFRQAVRGTDGLMQSRYKALRYSTYNFYLDRLGWATGFEQKLTSYCFRRGTGNVVDGKCNCVDIYYIRLILV